LVLGLTAAAMAPPSRADDADLREARRGRELFLRDWRVADSRCHGGDGLGPLYNATSCVACHGLGGPGGAGPKNTNVNLLNLAKFDSVSFNLFSPADAPQAQAVQRGQSQRSSSMTLVRGDVIDRLHPGLQASPAIVLHHFGTDPDYGKRRDALRALKRDAGRSNSLFFIDFGSDAPESPFGLNRVDAALLSHLRNTRQAEVTERNPTPLFGAGLIDAIPDQAILAAAGESAARSRAMHGRVHRLKGGLVGRFGWKAQVPSLQEFVLTACANELGLENPGHHQAPSPFVPDAMAKRPDLTGAECDALIAFVRDLPRPTVLDLGSTGSAVAREGSKLFASTGCADCHRPTLGDVDGIYSDLLLHDMGQSLSDSGQYYGSDDSNSSDGPSPSEWRTPPLWGLRESAPYLHDGRAKDIAEAVSFHSGEAHESAQKFASQAPEQKLRLETFLMSLTAPASPRELARRGEAAREVWAEGLARVESEAREQERRRAQAEEQRRAEAEKRQFTREAQRLEGLFQIAQMTEGNGHTKAALDLYREIVRDHPGTDAALKAQRRIDALAR
jgi:CxxC motif-containing protein (DUF1111 family)